MDIHSEWDDYQWKNQVKLSNQYQLNPNNLHQQVGIKINFK